MLWNSAPITATPKVPPTILLIESTPEATPAFSWVTEFMAAVDIGDMTSAMPKPMTMKEGSRSPYPVSTEMWVWINMATATSSRPVTISGRGPIRSESRPAIGAVTMISSVVGRKRTPAPSAL